MHGYMGYMGVHLKEFEFSLECCQTVKTFKMCCIIKRVLKDNAVLKHLL